MYERENIPLPTYSLMEKIDYLVRTMDTMLFVHIKISMEKVCINLAWASRNYWGEFIIVN